MTMHNLTKNDPPTFIFYLQKRQGTLENGISSTSIYGSYPHPREPTLAWKLYRHSSLDPRLKHNQEENACPPTHEGSIASHDPLYVEEKTKEKESRHVRNY